MVTGARGALRPETCQDTGARTGSGEDPGSLDSRTGSAGSAAGRAQAADADTAGAGRTGVDTGDTDPEGAGRTSTDGESGRLSLLRSWAGAVPDPELPMVSLAELGVLRGIRERTPEGPVEVELTPTYTGCPAIESMAADIEQTLHEHGVPEVRVRTVLAPPWSTDDITPEGRRKLAEAGIAPPRGGSGPRPSGPVPVSLAVRCPQCGSTETTLLSRFSSTACKALRRCESCGEPFDHFKEV